MQSRTGSGPAGVSSGMAGLGSLKCFFFSCQPSSFSLGSERQGSFSVRNSPNKEPAFRTRDCSSLVSNPVNAACPGRVYQRAAKCSENPSRLWARALSFCASEELAR